MSRQVMVIAPYPDMGAPIEGWYSRIRTVDGFFADRPRTYVNFAPHHRAGPDDAPVQRAPGVRQFNLNPQEPRHRAIFGDLFDRAGLVYCHTVHLARDILSWFPSDKIVVDIHGIAPEEEELRGQHERAHIFAEVEEKVLEQATNLVVVSQAMERHLRSKYPQTTARFVLLPIIELYAHRRSDALRGPDWERAQVLYAGGAHRWQNVDAMLKLAETCRDFADTLFLSHEPDSFARRSREIGVPPDCFRLRSARKEELPPIYARYNFGLVLRDDTAVNRVACPTKLSEYMDFGIVPVVRSPSIGDFEDERFQYVTEEEMLEGFLPDRRSQKLMRAANYGVIERIQARFALSAAEIRALAEA
jgi:hypothetical protein